MLIITTSTLFELVYLFLIMLMYHKSTVLLKGHLKNKKYFESVATDSNMWEQICIRGNELQFVGRGCNLWERIAIVFL